MTADQLDALADRIAERVMQRLARGLPRPVRITAADRAALDALLPAMWTPCGVSLFSMAELVAHAADCVHLAQAIERATGCHANDAGKRLGKLFRRAAGATVGGLQIHRVGDARGAALWQLGFTPPAAGVGLPMESNLPKPSSAETDAGRSPIRAA